MGEKLENFDSFLDVSDPHDATYDDLTEMGRNTVTPWRFVDLCFFIKDVGSEEIGGCVRSKRVRRLVFCLFFITTVCFLLYGLLVIIRGVSVPPLIRVVDKMKMTKDRAREYLDIDLRNWPKKNRKIPKIIHQIYSDDRVPTAYLMYIHSWVKNHPNYEYWLWDDESSRKLVEKYYPNFLPLFDAYCHDLFRSDVTRYFVLHKFGGMYVDMDYYSLRNVEPLMSGKQCLLVQENKEQAWVLYNKAHMVMNAWMASVPRHPFMNFTINNLPRHASCTFGDVLKSTGPLLLYKMKNRYMEQSGSCGKPEIEVTVLDSDLMMPRWDGSVPFKRKCWSKKLRWKLNLMQRNACKRMEDITEGFEIKIKALTGLDEKRSFASHAFLHYGNMAKKIRAQKRNLSVEISKLVNPLLDVL